MSEEGNEFVALLDKEYAQAEETLKAAENEIIERRKEYRDGFASRIAVALFHLEKQSETKNVWVTYHPEAICQTMVNKAIEALVARGHFVSHWTHPQFPKNDPTVEFGLLIYPIGAYSPGTSNRTLLKYLPCNLL